MRNAALNWPPPYTINKMQRARHVTVRVSLQKGLEFVVPPHYKIKDIPKLLKANKFWIQKQLRLVARESREIRRTPLPKRIYLAAVGQRWQVRYRHAANDMAMTADCGQRILTLTGPTGNKAKCKLFLNAWVKARAQKLLIPMLIRLSNTLGLTFTDVMIRAQAGRWASCTAQKQIRLNYKLIFLSKTLCKHILLHELCHTVHLDHSKRFWRLMGRYDVNWERHYDAMMKSEKWIPVWAR